MKGINTDEGKIKDFGWEEIHVIDESESYEIDKAILYKKGELFALLYATGCSCWDGNYEGWIDMTKEELLTLVKTTENTYGAEKTMREWIVRSLDEKIK